MICSLNASTDWVLCARKKNHSIIVKFVLDEEMQCGVKDGYSMLTPMVPAVEFVDVKLFLHTEDTSNHTIKVSKDKIPMDGKPVVAHGKNSGHAPKDYPNESAEWVTDIVMIQQAGPKEYNKSTFHQFCCKYLQSCAS